MSVTIEVNVMPSSGRQEFRCDKSGRIKVYLRSAAEKGKANSELIKLLAKAVGCTQEDVEIVCGALTRKKIIKFHAPFSLEMIQRALGLEKQLVLFSKHGG